MPLSVFVQKLCNLLGARPCIGLVYSRDSFNKSVEILRNREMPSKNQPPPVGTITITSPSSGTARWHAGGVLYAERRCGETARAGNPDAQAGFTVSKEPWPVRGNRSDDGRLMGRQT
jgi:hypothetical protein